MRFPCCSVLQENFVKEFECIISFLNSGVTSLDVWQRLVTPASWLFAFGREPV